MEPILDQLLAELNTARGIDFSGYRSNFLKRRIAARMAHTQCDSLSQYLNLIRSDPSECDRLIDTIGINFSLFFRDPIVFEILARTVLPRLLKQKQDARKSEIRVWSAGCAAGEEPYSVAILLNEALKGENNIAYSIFATDIDRGALKQAASATYPRESLEHTKLGILDKYFAPHGDGYRLRPFIRKAVHFSREDLTSPGKLAPAESVFGTFDIILCRNLMIYFKHELKIPILNKLCKSLAKGGYLFLGDSDSISREIKPRLKTIDPGNRIYQKLP